MRSHAVPGGRLRDGTPGEGVAVTDVVLFHHVLGRTEGVAALAEAIGAHGDTVHVPDLLDGRTFATIDEGVAHVDAIGPLTIAERGRAAVEGLAGPLVVVGLSLGVLPAQLLAQTDPRVRAAVLCHAAVPLGVLGDDWPDGVALQVHGHADDALGDVAEARALADAVAGSELHLVPGATHLFTDASLAEHDPVATRHVVERILALLDRVR